MSNPVHHTVGSIWRVWDLHFHTPSSYDVSDGAISNEEIVRVLTNAGVQLVVITDHHLMDVMRIRELQTLGEGHLVVLPGIEVPTELGGQRSVHVVAVFSEDCDLDETWKTLQVEHDLSPRQVEEIGNESVHVDCAEFSKTVHRLGGVVIAHAGTKCNGIEEIGNSTAFKQAFKTGLARNSIDFFEIANRSNVSAYRDIVFPRIGKILPLVLCSDWHCVDGYVPPECWIKADPSFLGLLQVLQDPWERVELVSYPSSMSRVKQDATRYVSKVSFARIPDSELEETWFDGQEVLLNTGLVAIIGNKGSGKSAFAETLGLLGGCENVDYFSFLHPDKFLKGRNRAVSKAAQFSAKLEWADGSDTSLLLSDSNEDLDERLRYIPQKYLETICNELQSVQGSQFRLQLEQVVMSHVPHHDRIGHETIESLIRYRTAEVSDALAQARKRLGDANRSIEVTEKRLLPEHLEQLQRQLKQKTAEITALEEAAPEEMPKPSEDADPEQKAKVAAAEKAESELKTLATALERVQASQRTETQAKISCEKLLRAVANFKDSYRNLETIWADEAANVDIPLEDVLKLTIELSPLEQRIEAANTALATLNAEADVKVENSLANRHAIQGQELTSLREELSAPQRAFEKYKEQRAAFAEKKAGLVGDIMSPGTKAYLDAAIAELEGLPEELEQQRTERESLVREIFAHLETIRDVYRELYKPVQGYIETHPLASDKMKLEFDASITEDGLTESFFQVVRQDRRGTFFQGGHETLLAFLRGADLTTADEVLSFIRELEESMHNDKRQTTETPVVIDDQLKDGATRADFYNVLYSLNYLSPTYSLKWAGKELDQLSPGEKGALLLVFYLLIDRDTKPLVIDQPEENLDNESVYEILVPCINRARLQRQIIIVTHNPNLAVVCDADQVIRASLNVEADYMLTYSAGAIENPEINKDIIDVLEGTKPAFKKRDAKYTAAQPAWLQERLP